MNPQNKDHFLRFLPSIYKLLDLVKVPVSQLWIKELLARFLNEVKSAALQKVLHWAEKAGIWWPTVRTVGWIWQYLNAVQFFKLGFPGNVWFCIVLLHQSTFSVDQIGVFFLQLFVDLLQLLIVKFVTTVENQLKMHNSFKIPPNPHDFLGKSILFWNRLSCPFLIYQLCWTR